MLLERTAVFIDVQTGTAGPQVASSTAISRRISISEKC